MFQACLLPGVSPRTGVGHRSLGDVRAIQLADRKSDTYRHVLETVVSDCLEEGLVGGLDFTVDVSLRPTEMLFAHRKRRPVSSRRLRPRARPA